MLSVPFMAEPPTPGAHVPLEFERRPHSRITQAFAVLRHGIKAPIRPSRLRQGIVTAHTEGRAVRAKVNETFTERRRTKVELHIEIDTPWPREQPSNPRPEMDSAR
jgi:hypothetical protein